MKKLIFGYGATGKSVETYFKKNNIEYLIYDDDIIAKNSLEEILAIAQILPAPGWMERIKSIKPKGPIEKFLKALREQVYTHNTSQSNFYVIKSFFRNTSFCFFR